MHIRKKHVANYQTRAFGLENNLNDDSAHFLYIPSGLTDPLVCWGSCNSPDMEFAAQAMEMMKALDLLHMPEELLPKGMLNAPYVSTMDVKVTQVLKGFRDEDEFIISWAYKIF